MAGQRAQEIARAKLPVTAARLAALVRPAGGAWARAARGAAEARLLAQGLAGPRDEYWRYTDPASLTAPVAAAAAGGTDPSDAFAGMDAVRLVFVDGAFDVAASDDPDLAGVEITRLADAAMHDIHWVRDMYGVLEARGQNPVARPFAALNTAFAGDGVVIRDTGQVPRPVAIVYRSSGGATDAMLHHVVRVEPGASLTLLESGSTAARGNTVLEVDVGEGAAFHHVRVQTSASDTVAATHVFARLAAKSVLKSFTLSTGGRLTRNEMVVDLVGDDAVAHVAGAAAGAAGFHHDDTVFVTHAGLRCESRQVFKKVLAAGATGVFQGKILVAAGAQKTDGYQISQALLLADEAQFLAKPELEIYADDVKCSHGSTTGAIDETALFYLRSRGVPLAQAQALLVLSFLSDAVAEIEDARIADAILAQVDIWLAERQL